MKFSIFTPDNAVRPPTYTGHAERERFILDLVLPAQTIAPCINLQVGDHDEGGHSCRVKFSDFSDSPGELNDVLRDLKELRVDDLRESAISLSSRHRAREVQAGAGMCAQIEVLDLPGQAKSRRLVQAVAEHMHAHDLVSLSLLLRLVLKRLHQHATHATTVHNVKLVIFSSQSRKLCDALRVPSNLRRRDPPVLLISRLEIPLQ